jgi:hypothetical protein
MPEGCLRTIVAAMTTTSLDSGTTPATDALRLLVDDVFLSVSAVDADRFSSGTAAGQALLSLAALARRAAGALAAESPGTLDGAPGSAVQQEFADAARLLAEAADAAHGESWQIADLLVRAERVQAQLAVSGG